MSKEICIIGGGPGGYVAAVRASQLGNKVTLIEKEELGGTCLNWGCIPSKIMKASSELFEKTNEFSEFGIELSAPVQFNMPKLQEKKKKIISTQIKGIDSILAHNNVTIIKGTAQIRSQNEVLVKSFDNTEAVISFDKLIIACGTKIKELKGLEFDHENILSSDDLLSLNYIPKSIAIIGGGIIGCEFASILQGLGSQVYLIEAQDRLLPIENIDKDISKALQREYKKKKIKIFTDSFASVKESNQEGFTLEITPKDQKKKTTLISCHKIAVCTGRIPDTKTLGLDNLEIKTNEAGWIKVDKNYETSTKNIYAIGDILGPDYSMLAHTASFEGRICAEKISGNNFTELDYEKIPGAVFTTPEIGCIGLTEEMAQQKGHEVLKEKVLFRTSGKAHAIGEIAGEASIIADKNTKVILGIHIIGPHASDLLGEASLAVQQEISTTQLSNTVHAHPTLSELIMEAGLKLSGLGIHG